MYVHVLPVTYRNSNYNRLGREINLGGYLAVSVFDPMPRRDSTRRNGQCLKSGLTLRNVDTAAGIRNPEPEVRRGAFGSGWGSGGAPTFLSACSCVAHALPHPTGRQECRRSTNDSRMRPVRSPAREGLSRVYFSRNEGEPSVWPGKPPGNRRNSCAADSPETRQMGESTKAVPQPRDS